MLYRGCKEANLKVMYPRLVNHKSKYVYATNDLVEAIIYSVKGGNFNYTNIYGYDDNGFMVNDPGSYDRSCQYWPYGVISGDIEKIYALGSLGIY